MSRRKAGCTPRRVDPAPAANSDDETEMRDLIIDVKPEPNPWPLQALALGPFSPKEVPAPGRLEGEPRHSPGPVPAGGPLHAFSARNQWAPWMPLIPNPHGERPLLGAPPPSPFSRVGPPPPDTVPQPLPYFRRWVLASF